MCDAEVRADTVWPRWYACERPGKYEVKVTDDDHYSKEKTSFTVNLCGQHKNMLGSGKRLYVKYGGKSFSVRGEMDERGIAKKAIEDLTWDLSQYKHTIKHRERMVAQEACYVAPWLIEAIEGDERFSDLVAQLKSWNNEKDIERKMTSDLSDAEEEYKRLRTKG